MPMYSEIALAHMTQPRNVGPPEGEYLTGQAGEPGDGPWVRLYLRVEEFRGPGKKSRHIIEKAGYHTYGCPATIASASAVCELVTGKSTEAALEITQEDVLLALGDLPEGKRDRPYLALAALKKGIEKIGSKERSPR